MQKGTKNPEDVDKLIVEFAGPDISRPAEDQQLHPFVRAAFNRLNRPTRRAVRSPAARLPLSAEQIEVLSILQKRTKNPKDIDKLIVEFAGPNISRPAENQQLHPFTRAAFGKQSADLPPEDLDRS